MPCWPASGAERAWRMSHGTEEAGRGRMPETAQAADGNGSALPLVPARWPAPGRETGKAGMPREITDHEGIVWTCIQAFAGLGNDAEKQQAALVEGARDRVHVACTPSGGAHSVRLELPADWESTLSDEDLAARIRASLDREQET